MLLAVRFLKAWLDTIFWQGKCFVTQQTKSSLAVWVQYLLIAFIAEWGASMALFPYEPGNDINLHGYIQKEVVPHLFWWFIIFMVISLVKLSVGFISRRGRKKDVTKRG
jgi:hypothetical protein